MFAGSPKTSSFNVLSCLRRTQKKIPFHVFVITTFNIWNDANIDFFFFACLSFVTLSSLAPVRKNCFEDRDSVLLVHWCLHRQKQQYLELSRCSVLSNYPLSNCGWPVENSPSHRHHDAEKNHLSLPILRVFPNLCSLATTSFGMCLPSGWFIAF